MIDDRTLHALEWSHELNAFSVIPLHELTKINRASYLHDTCQKNDFRLMHVGTKAECLLLAQNCAPTMAKRAAQRSSSMVEA